MTGVHPVLIVTVPPIRLLHVASCLPSTPYPTAQPPNPQENTDEGGKVPMPELQHNLQASGALFLCLSLWPCVLTSFTAGA